MSVTIKTKGQYPVSNWSGGSTTELYLDPPQASYAQRNFGVRVSSATVECERSQFTALPGVERIILPLRGQLHLYYEGHGGKLLQPFEQDRFDGGWHTESIGKATDFNVMLREGRRARVEVLSLTGGEESRVLPLAAQKKYLIFAAQGQAILSVDNRQYLLPDWGLAVVEQETEALMLTAPNPAKLVAVELA